MSGAGGPVGRATAGARSLQLVVATALVLLVGATGSASAVVLVGSRQIKDGSLTGRDLAPNTVVGSDVRDHSLAKRDFGVVPRGLPGETGRIGDRGITGDIGETDSFLAPVVPRFSTQTYDVPCASPQRAVFGASSLPAIDLHVLQSAPAVNGSSWTFVVRNASDTDWQVSLSAVCVVDR